MDFISIKNQSKKTIKDTIIKYILENEFDIFNNNKDYISNIINNYINNIKLSDFDYDDIKNDVIEELLIKNPYIHSKEIDSIIKSLSNKIKNYSLEYSFNDNEPYIYFHLTNNQSYIINYDYIEKKWYFALVETDTFNLIEEIYNDTYTNLIYFINNKF